MKVHLDTDIGGDPDDACALGLLLGSTGVEITGITTVLDQGGFRAGCAAHYLRLARRSDVPVFPGAGAPLGSDVKYESTADDRRFWDEPVAPVVAPCGAALDLIRTSIEAGATVVAIGPLTNLAMLNDVCPGILGDVPVVFMGGWITSPEPGLPQWGPDRDWNTQCDIAAAKVVAALANLTLVPLPTTLKAHLRASHLQRLRISGSFGELLARQSEAHATDTHMRQLGRSHDGLPDDLLNFHYDPLTVAVALGWPGVTREAMSLLPAMEGADLRFKPNISGRQTRVVVDVDGAAFSEFWLTAIESI